MELQKARPQSDDLSDSSDQVYLKSTWVVTSLRHPALRMLCCFVHLVLSFYLAVTSPLLTSLQSPPRFPVYGNLVKAATTGFTWQKIVFQLVMNLSLIVFLRIVAYPRLVQHHWNWKTSYRHATQTFSRLSRASASDITADMSQSGTVNRTDVIALQTFVSGGVRDTPAVRLNAWIVGSSKGSWTFIAATFPFLWATVMWVVRKIAHGSDLEEWLFPEDMNETWTDLTQNKLQQALSTALLSLSCLRMLVTLDWVLQDHEYTRVLFRNWLGPVRRVYAKLLAARILWCWFAMLGVAIGGVCFGAISMLQNEWIRWKLENVDGVNDLESWLSNASWNTLLSSLLIALDLLWVLQDWNFPSFTSPLGLRMFGLHVDHIKLRFPFRFQLVLSSKWIGGFLVMALLLPLEICQFLQIADYSPEMYAQHVHVTSFRVFPLNVTESDSSFNNKLDSTSRLILQAGSLSRYFQWSEWDRAPACIVLLLATTGLLWLSAKERCKMCFAVFLGLSGEQERRAKVLSKISRSVPATVNRELRTQQRLRSLYKLRARSDSFCIWLAIFSVLTVWLQFRAIWRSPAKYHHDLPLQTPGEAYAALLLLITLILLHQVHYRYCVKLEIMVLRNQLPPDCRFLLWRSPRLLLLPFLIELLLCGVFLPPLIHGSVYFDEERYSLPKATLEVLPACPRPLTMTISNQSCDLEYSYPLEIVNMVVLLRLYWFARVIRNQLSKQLVADKATARPAIFSGKEVSVDSLWWSFRISFALRPSKVLLTLFTTLWVSTAAAVSIFERPFPSKLDGKGHALWLTLVTMTGVGYGDAYSITLGGRIAIVLGAVVGGLTFMSLMTSEFLDSLTGTKREHAVLSAMEKLKWERSLRIYGAQLIQSLWQCHRAKVSGSKQQNVRKPDRRLVNAVQQFKLCRKRKPMQSANASLVLQKSGLSAFYSREVEIWMVSRQAKTAAQLDSLEQQMDNLENSLQPLLQVSMTD